MLRLWHFYWTFKNKKRIFFKKNFHKGSFLKSLNLWSTLENHLTDKCRFKKFCMAFLSWNIIITRVSKMAYFSDYGRLQATWFGYFFWLWLTRNYKMLLHCSYMNLMAFQTRDRDRIVIVSPLFWNHLYSGPEFQGLFHEKKSIFFSVVRSAIALKRWSRGKNWRKKSNYTKSRRRSFVANRRLRSYW